MWKQVALIVLGLPVAGCGGSSTPPPSPAGNATTVAPVSPEATAAPPPRILKQVGVERIDAKMGVGKHGRAYGGGLVTEPIRQKFLQEQKIILEIQLPQLMLAYDLEVGHPPKSHEEFMAEIIQKYGVKLPELPEGDTYVYDPESKKLMVERPILHDEQGNRVRLDDEEKLDSAGF